MKVLAIGETREVRSGWGRYAHEVITGLEAKGVEVDFVSSAELLPFSKINLFRNALRLRKHIKNGVDVIHAFDVWPFAVYALIANMGVGKPLFVSGVGTYSIPPEKGVKSWLMRRALTKAREVFCISRYTRRLLKESADKANLSIVPWGATKLPEIPESEGQEYKNKFSIPEGMTPIIITVGQIKNRKGQLDTLKALPTLLKKYPKILYVVVGSTADKTYVQKMRDFAKTENLEDHLRIVDTQKTDRELAYLYSISTIFAMNSNNESDHFEGFGLVFVEAAQFGKPAVGSRGCGIEDAIVDGETGYLTNQGDSKDIAEKVDKLLSGDVEKFGEAAKNYGKNFTWQKTVESYLEGYQRN
jgi:phosphatidyl-myo-inositol dimannoside synthase